MRRCRDCGEPHNLFAEAVLCDFRHGLPTPGYSQERQLAIAMQAQADIEEEATVAWLTATDSQGVADD